MYFPYCNLIPFYIVKLKLFLFISYQFLFVI